MKTYMATAFMFLVGLTVAGNAFALEHPRDASSKARGQDYQFWVQSAPAMHLTPTAIRYRQERPSTIRQFRQTTPVVPQTPALTQASMTPQG